MAKARSPATSDEAAISVLLEEYRALYAIVLFRMTSLERRVPIGAVALIGLLASVLALDPSAQLAVLIVISAGLYWYLATTINHARSFEDVLRRIDEIEREVNTLAGRELILFQSSHPSRGKHVGGRTGNESIRAVYASAMLTLLACLWLFWRVAHPSAAATVGYSLYVSATAVTLYDRVRRLARYRYSEHRAGKTSGARAA